MIVVPGFRVTELLQEDAEATAYRAVREHDGRSVILKAVPPSAALATARLRHEWEIERDLALPGVVTACGLERCEGGLALVLEDDGSRPLVQFIPPGGMAPDAFLAVAAHLTETLGDLHARRIIHQDLQPRHILVNPQTGQVRLAGFGIASRLASEEPSAASPNLHPAALAYLSPEQTGRMNQAIDYRTDFYSLGVTFYRMLTDRCPFESDDPLELVHCHIARVPIPPHEVNPAVPAALGGIVMKLLAKTPEGRYQSARGLQADLDRCRAEWQERGAIAPFPPGEQDRSSEFRIPQRLYGRETEVDALVAAFDRVGEGAAELLLVSGYSGIGKSSLVQEIQKPVVRWRGFFASGKFDQFRRDVPFASLIQAFRELVRQLLTESGERLAGYRAELLEAVGPNGQVILDVIPEVELILGPQSPVPPLGAQEAQNRFQLVFQRFVGVFTRREHPLVLFLDDLQWADAASLKLVQALVCRPEQQFLLVIGAYRDNEVSPSHPLMLTLDEIRRAGAVVREVALRGLSAGPLRRLLAETLDSEDRARLEPLARLVLQKTGGNPFFLNQLLKSLHQDGLIAFDPRGGCWTWDLARIQQAGITDNVVEFMAAKIQRLPETTQQLLQIAACIGGTFDSRTLAVALEQPPEDLAAALWPALLEGLVVPLDESYRFFHAPGEDAGGEVSDPAHPSVPYRFVHDRVQQAAYSLIAEGEREQVHLRIGRLLLRHEAPGERDERLFDIVGHLNLARGRIEPAERAGLIELNQKAGRKAKLSTAYDAARRYFAAGCELLPEDAWERDRTLAFELHRESAECAYLTGDHEAAAALLDLLRDRAAAPLERADVYRLRTLLHTTQCDYGAAVQSGIDGLKALGVPLEAAPTAEEIGRGLEEAKRLQGSRTAVELTELPEMADPMKRAAMAFLAILYPAAYVSGNQGLCTLITLKMVHLTLEHGISDDSCQGFLFYGATLAAGFQDYRAGFEFGELALRLAGRSESGSRKCMVSVAFPCLISPWRRHLLFGQEILREAHLAGMEAGETVYSAWAVFHLVTQALLAGSDLAGVEGEIEKYIGYLDRLREGNLQTITRVTQQLCRNLQGRTRGRGSLDDAEFDEARAFSEVLAREDNQTGRCWYHIARLMLSYHWGEYLEALAMSREAEKILNAMVSLPYLAEWNFYTSLTLAALYPQASARKKREYRRIFARNQEQMRTWAENCPENFRHKHLLVAAEQARLAGRADRAMDLYDQAIEAAREHGFVNNEALACEAAARFYLSRGRIPVAREYLERARRGFLRWGATARAELLPDGEALGVGRWALGREAPALKAQGPTPNAPVPLDLATIFKAAQAVSSEIDLSRLLEQLMRLSIENAGAERGVLILDRPESARAAEAGPSPDPERSVPDAEQAAPPEEGTTLVIAAEGTVEHIAVFVSRPVPLEESDAVPESIIRYVARTRENVIVADAVREARFGSDPYIQARQTKAVLCTPILNKGRLTGVLYLENPLASGAFRPDRLELLKLLTAQAAISIETAGLYARVRESEHRLRAVMRNVPAILFTLDPAGIFTLSEGKTLELLGRRPGQVVGRSIFEVYREYPEVCAAVRRALAGETFASEVQIRGRAFEAWYAPFPAADGAMAGVIGVAMDVTERKRAEEEHAQLAREQAARAELEEREQQFRTLANSVSQFAWMADATGYIFWYNDRWYEYTGTTLGEMQGWGWRKVHHPDEVDRVVRRIRHSFDTGAPWEDTFPLRSKDGEYRWFLSRARPIHDAGGRVVRWFGTNTDVTEQRELEQALRQAGEELEHRVAARTAELSHANATLKEEVAERRKAEEALLRQTEIFESILANMGDAVVVADRQLRFLVFNPAAERMFGQGATETTPEEWSEQYGLYQPDGVTPFPADEMPLARCIRGEAVDDVEILVRHANAPDGLWTRVSGRPLRDAGGGVAGGVVVCTDITARKRAEEQLSLLQTIAVEVGAAGDLASALEVVLRRVCDKTGWELGQAWLPRPDGSALTCAPIGYCRDEHLDGFRAASGQIALPPGVGLPGRVWVSKQPAWIQDVTLDPNFPRAQAAAEAGLKAAFAIPILSGDRVVTVLEFFLRDPRAEDERLVNVITAVARQLDMVIERAQTGEALRASAARLRLATGSAGLGVFEWDAVADQAVWENDRMYEIFGRSREDGALSKEEFVGQYVLPEDVPGFEQTLTEALQRGQSFHAECRIRRNDGEVRWVEFAGKFELSPEGLPLRLVCVFGDITERRRAQQLLEEYNRTLELTVAERTGELIARNRELEETLRQLREMQQRVVMQEKMASLGALTAGVAHEIKNPLNFVNNFALVSAEMAEELEEELESQKERLDPKAWAGVEELLGDLRQNAEKIHEHGARADQIVRSMLLHARGQNEAGARQTEPTDLNALVHEAVNLAYHGGRARDTRLTVRIEEAYDPAVGVVEVMAPDLSRVFLNLANNACYAAHRRAQEEGPPFEAALNVSTSRVGGRVEVRLRDNGRGIPAEVRDRIFDPFFTTKPQGEGTGLGLSISYDIVVNQHRGDLRFETEAERFTEFVVTLPAQGTASNR